jgi:hypothetical protein
MSAPARSCSTSALLDVGQVFELFAAVIDQRQAAARPARPRSIVGDCLQRAGVDEATTGRIQRGRLRDLYARHDLPFALTLGAALALDAARRSERLGLDDDDVLAYAIAASVRLLDLLPTPHPVSLDLLTHPTPTATERNP